MLASFLHRRTERSDDASQAEKNAISLSVAAALCGGAWSGALAWSMRIESYIQGDGRTGVILLLVSPLIFMTLLYQLLVFRQVLVRNARGWTWCRGTNRMILALNLIALSSLLGTAIFILTI